MCSYLSFWYAKNYRSDEFGRVVNEITGILFAVASGIQLFNLQDTSPGKVVWNFVLISAIVSVFFSRGNPLAKENRHEKENSDN